MINTRVASIEFCGSYCREFPYSPHAAYPEYPFTDLGAGTNYVYETVRNHLKNLGLDQRNFNTKDWNPLGEFELKGKNIVIKPNWVMHVNPLHEDIWGMITHPSFIRVLLDYIFIATKGECNVVIGDAPLQTADMDIILKESMLHEMQQYFSGQGMEIRIEDWRLERAFTEGQKYIVKTVRANTGADSHQAVNLYERSCHSAIDRGYRKYRVTNYDRREMLKHHRIGHHEYLISRTVLDSDFFINIPKMKTHHKAGLTLSLKNLIGINCSKDWLPHHRKGSKSGSSDEYKNFSPVKSLSVTLYEFGFMTRKAIPRRILILLSKVLNRLHRFILRITGGKYYSEGNWYGNDTIWRTCLDINAVLFYAEKEGKMARERSGRSYLTVIDGVIGGEKEGPLRPSPVNSRLSVAALNPAVSDYVTARIIGMDPEKIPVIHKSFSKGHFPVCEHQPGEIEVRSSNEAFNGGISCLKTIRKYEPSSGWKGHIEYQ